MSIFEYPFNDKNLYTKRKSLRRSLIEKILTTEKKVFRIAVLGGSTTTDIVQVLDLFLLNSGIEAEFYQSDYNRYTEEVLFDQGKLWDFKPDLIFIHTTIRNLNFSENALETFSKFEKIWRTIKQKSGALIIQNNFELPEVRTLGNLDSSLSTGKTNIVNQLNKSFAEQTQKYDGLYINDINYLSSFLGSRAWFDSSFWTNFKFPYSSEATVYVAKSALNIILATQGKIKKCLVLDLDNTLWGGIIGDDGVEGIVLGEGHPVGEAYLAFQQYVKELKNRGIILAVCSKNDPRLARKGFDHPESILKVEDFSSFQANWEMKTENLKKISDELNIGLDSLVFIDDNPVERDLIQTVLPMVAVPDIGEEVSEYARYIDINGYFESVKILKEDLSKFSYYAENKVRKEKEGEFQDYEEFLLSLTMTAEIVPFSEISADRITQLINKTNQFNLTNLRIDRNKVDSLIDDSNAICLSAKLKDKFGDNGLVSVISSHIQEQEAFIDIWVMSCRVFKRDLEMALFDKFIEACLAKGLTTVVGFYNPSEKNAIVASLYEDLGFKRKNESQWVLSDLKNYLPKNKVIKIN